MLKIINQDTLNYNSPSNTNMSKTEFIKEINKLRIENKNNWFCFSGTVENKLIRIKGFEKWIQICTVNGVNYFFPMGIKTVREFNRELENIFN